DARLLVDDRVPGRDAMRDRLIRVEAASGHAQRDKKKLADRGLIRLARDDLDEPAENRKARVRVMPNLAERGQLLELGHSRYVARERVIALAEVGEAITEPTASVGHKMPEGRALCDFLIAELEFRQVAPDRCIQIERAALDQAHDHGRGH